MFDPDLLEKNRMARDAVKLLYESGILHQQKAALLDRLAAGDPGEPEDKMILRIREFRQRTAFVESLIEFTESFQEQGSE